MLVKRKVNYTNGYAVIDPISLTMGCFWFFLSKVSLNSKDKKIILNEIDMQTESDVESIFFCNLFIFEKSRGRYKYSKQTYDMHILFYTDKIHLIDKTNIL